jgi:RNA polymerase sigma-70 factor (ECF subfamily)
VGEEGLEASDFFERLYEAQYGSIYAYVRRRMASSLDVADVVSEVFTVAWRRIDDLPSPPQDRLWLFGVAQRCLLAHQRQRWSHARLLSMLESQSNRIELVDVSGDPLHFRVQSALESLRFKDREVLTLVYWDGLTHADAAIVLGCSVNAVALRVKKAKARLQSKLSPTDVGETALLSPPLLTPRKEHLP